VTALSDLARAALYQAHTDIDRRGERVTRVGLVKWCDEQREAGAETVAHLNALGELRDSIIATALIEADEAAARNTPEAVAAERDRIRRAVFDAVAQAGRGVCICADHVRVAIANRTADALTR